MTLATPVEDSVTNFLRFVDCCTGAEILFRGNLPIVNGKFFHTLELLLLLDLVVILNLVIAIQFIKTLLQVVHHIHKHLLLVC